MQSKYEGGLFGLFTISLIHHSHFINVAVLLTVCGMSSEWLSQDVQGSVFSGACGRLL